MSVSTALNITELTTGELNGIGTFDVLLRSVKAHLDHEFKGGRIKGPEYATVYLGSLELAMQTGLAFVLQKRKNDLEAQLLEKQIELIAQQVLNAAAEGMNIPKQGEVLDAQKAQVTQSTLNLVSEKLGIVAKTAMTTQQTLNAVTEGLVLQAQKCKLQAEFDFTQAQTTKSAQELALLAQKTATERAQVTALGVDADSVVGRQKALYQAQTSGFARDAEQKAAKLMADTWSVRRTTDEGTVADATNKLNDATVGRVITKLLDGVGA